MENALGSMVDRIVVITGANSGIGFESARGLASLGASVVMVCRDPARGAVARDAVAAVSKGEAPTLLIADLADQSQIRALASVLHARLPRIDVLLNNAGAAFPRRELTVDGFERTFAVNHLAPFLLTNLVAELVRVAPQGRVITVSSDLHSDHIDFDDLQCERNYGWVRAYALSKLGNILFTKELARRVAYTGVTANCLEPGPALTQFGRGAGGTLGFVARLMQVAAFVGIAANAEEGARTPIYLAASPEVEGVSGRYFRRSREADAKPITDDIDVAGRLWKASERMTSLSGSATRRSAPTSRTAPAMKEDA